jgi:hypothetical protein
MPLVPFAMAGVLTPALLGVGMLGLATPKFSLGVSIGVAQWLKAVTVTTTDAGSLGVGSGQLPLIVPQPILLTNILTSMASLGLAGVMMPLKSLGLSVGLTGGLVLGLIKTTHPTVGAGTGVAKFSPTPAPPFIVAGLAQAGLVGPSVVKIATAIGMGLNKTFLLMALPIPIVGAASPSAGAGVGFGVVI